jgi:hypothetical protein
MKKRSKAKSSYKESKVYAGKTREEWRDWGEEFGMGLDKGGKEFGKSMEEMGGRIREHVKSHRGEWREWRRERRGRLHDWWFGTFGLIAPLLGSVFGIVLLLLGILALNIINLSARSYFVYAVSAFLFSNLYLFFAVSLLMGYGKYFSRRYGVFWIVSPFIKSIGITFVIWIAIFVLDLINVYSGSSFIAAVSNFLRVNLLGIFVVLVVLGYVFEFFIRVMWDMFDV